MLAHTYEYLTALIFHCWTLFSWIIKSELATARTYDFFAQDARQLIYLVARFSERCSTVKCEQWWPCPNAEHNAFRQFWALRFKQREGFFFHVGITWIWITRSTLKSSDGGLPWWRSGWESACQCRGHGFEPWSGKIPHAAEQLGLWATTTEPARLEPVLRNKRGRDGERPAHRDEEWPPLAATRESPRTETKTQHSHK